MRVPLTILLMSICGVSRGGEMHTFTAADGSFSGEGTLTAVETDRDGALLAVIRRKLDNLPVRVKLASLSNADIAWVDANGRALMVPAILNGRLTPESRSTMRKAHGSDPAAEDSINLALGWLAARQNADGSWGKAPATGTGMTGLALLAMAGQGHGCASPLYGNAIKRAASWLRETAIKNAAPFTGVLSTGPSVISSAYAHAIATQALAEVLALSRSGTDPLTQLKGTVENAADIIIKKQQPQGAWGYKDGIGYDPYGRNDLSVTGWQIQALWLCREAGILRPNMPGTMAKAAAYFQSAQTTGGGFGVTDRSSHYNQWNLSGAVLSNLYALRQSAPSFSGTSIRKGFRWLSGELKKEPLSWTQDCYLYV